MIALLNDKNSELLRKLQGEAALRLKAEGEASSKKAKARDATSSLEAAVRSRALLEQEHRTVTYGWSARHFSLSHPPPS
jgi:hypothetical protein